MKNCTQVLRAILCLCLFAVTGIVPAFSQQIKKGINVSNGDYLGFLEYKPSDYDPKSPAKYPIIIFLHGIGERGNGTTELNNVACCAIPRIIRGGHKMKFTWNGKTETFIVLSPQCPRKYGMWPQILIDELIQYAKENLRIDTNRIFLTGLSMGGGGTYKYISTSEQAPKKIAAAATICAPCSFNRGSYVARANLPLWSFHAADDYVALASCTEDAINKVIWENPAVKPLKTIWPTGGHGVWDRVYTDTNYIFNGALNIYEWFLGQNKSLAVNRLPIARAGKDITISRSAGVAILDASASADADGKLVRYVWKKLSGPSAGVITNRFTGQHSTTVTGLTVEGNYSFELTVVDDRAAVAKDTVSLTVAAGPAPIINKPPVARAGNDIVMMLPQNAVTVSADASTDEDGTIAAYEWTKVSGPALTIQQPASPTTKLSSLVEGVYIMRLKVTDNKGATSEDNVTVIVKPAAVVPNNVPVAKAGNDITITLPTNKVMLNSAGSADPDGSISSYQWSKVSGPAQFRIVTPAATATELSSLVEGKYTVRLKITDNKGAIAEDFVNVTVLTAPPPPNKAPVSEAGANKTITLPLNTVTLDGTASSDADGTIDSYAWSRISGPSDYEMAAPDSAVTVVSGLTRGTYLFRLEIADNNGAKDADTVQIRVNESDIPPPPPNKLPVARAGHDIIITLPVDEAALNGSTSSDADGTIINYSWSKLSGPAHYSIVSPRSALTTVKDLVQGTYVFTLQVKDDDGASARDTITVTVRPALNDGPVADAGADIRLVLPESSARLDGLDSHDPDGEITSYDWVMISGAAGVTLTNSTTATPDVVGLKEGEYQCRLTVTDNSGASSSDVMRIIVLALPAELPIYRAPVAAAGEDRTISYPDGSVDLDGTASYDQDGSIATYGWTLLSGPGVALINNADSALATAEGLSTGQYVFELTVSNRFGVTSRDTVLVDVISNLKYEQQLSVFPNPAHSTIRLQLTSDTSGQTSVSVYSAAGTRLKTSRNTKTQPAYYESVDISALQPGVYYLEVIVGGKQRMISKFIKQ